MRVTDLSTVAQNVRVKIPVGACRFFASVAKTESEEEAKAFVERVCAEFPDATHNAYAYKLGLGDGAICRQCDAGEPSGTAGPPMLQAIEHAGLTNVTVVATRYFGGVKLGIGGLVRAYRTCADAGLAEAGRITAVCMSSLYVKITYELLGPVMREIAAGSGVVDGVDYQADGVAVTCRVPVHHTEQVKAQIIEATRGKANVEIGHTTR